MAYRNSVTVVGNMTRDPQLRTNGEGRSYTFITLAVNEGQGDSERAYFVDVSVNGRSAENVVDSLTKGDEVIVMGTVGNKKLRTLNKDDEEFETTTLTINAVHIGAGLAFAKADLTKNPKKASNFDDDEVADAGRGNRPRKAQADDEEGDEEPVRRQSRSAEKPAGKPAGRTRQAAPADDDDF